MIRLRQISTAFGGFLWLGLWSATLAAQSDSSPQFRNFNIGSYRAVALEDGELEAPNDGSSFVIGHTPAEVAAVLRSGGVPTDQIHLSIQPLLVEAGDRVLLFDTGAGSAFGPIAGKLPQSFAAAGKKPQSVTDIFISHAHGDHIDGLVDPNGALAFPNATIHMSAPEWRWLSGMTVQDGKQIGIADPAALAAAIRSKVAPFEPGAELITGVVKAVDIKGHTPGSTGYLIGSGKDTLLFVGDTLHHYIVSVRRPSWQIAFDTDKKVGAASRAALVSRVAASGQRLYAVHFPFPGVGRIERQKDGDRWVPEQLQSR
ncbi:MAG TPA: MBL fold metallo-hydrolase [Steroidobacteraceae bacterium]|nr:MBL fold metallo-hydrolase [Steroidobacteraceae bacterium]